METYLVGGAVRDKLLGRDASERDWVVVGATPQEMKSLGYKQVGADFPVFLHPDTHEEYALARTERKTAPGYHGFSFDADARVTLEQDLVRRDLTINALAEDERGQLIDYHGGQQDLQNRVLRHVSPAFAEDPVRILRVARFAARFQPLGFTVAESTRTLMRAIVDNGEVDALVPERVWQELVKALGEETPTEFFQVLRECGALERLFPEIDRLFGVPQPPEYHPEIDTGVHTMLVLTEAAKLSDDIEVRFAALIHDLGKGTTPRMEWPSHRGHEQRGGELVRDLCARLKSPKAYRELARRVAVYHLRCHRALELKASTVLKTLEALDAFRRARVFEQFLLACEADFRGRTGFETRPYPQASFMRAARAAALNVDAKSLAETGLSGEAIAQAIRERRIGAIKEAKGNFR
ncbi:MAG: multifunctional CCA addition/repair protein [Gammaproteobacteria bacterium]